MYADLISRIHDAVTPVLTSLDLRLWGARVSGSGRRPQIQIFIDADAGISADMCASASEMLMPALDTVDGMYEDYVLEVSSPGLDCYVFNAREAQLCVGQRVRAELTDGKVLNGILTYADAGGKITVAGGDAAEDSACTNLELKNTKTLRVVPQFAQPQAKPRGRTAK